MSEIKNTRAVAALGAFISSFLWSTAFVAIKIGYRYYSGQFTFAGIRFFLAGVILLLFSLKYMKMFFANFKVLFIMKFLMIAQQVSKAGDPHLSTKFICSGWDIIYYN